jgi:hypothetical protein
MRWYTAPDSLKVRGWSDDERYVYVTYQGGSNHGQAACLKVEGAGEVFQGYVRAMGRRFDAETGRPAPMFV